MGDPKKQRKKYSTPGHPWERERIDEEKKLMAEYGFKNKSEIWKMTSFLRDATAQAKKLITLTGPQAEKEKDLLLNRLRRYGLLSQEAGIDAILSISLRDLLERRLQTQVYKKNLANSVKQARQFITHEHICVGSKVITSPSYLVSLSEEAQMSFRASSNLSNEEHPERAAARKVKEMAAKLAVVVKEGDDEEKKPKKAPKKTSKSAPKKQDKPAAEKPTEDKK